MKNETIIKTRNFVMQLHANDTSGHDWWHIQRVTQLALQIASKENADSYLVELAALLHDVDDWKLGNTNPNKTQLFLEDLGISQQEAVTILTIIGEVSFKGAGVETPTTSIESQCVQDADRLDALGAIGIARAFTYGGSKNRSLYEPNIDPVMHGSFQEYKVNQSHTINHFYEKLLLLKDRMTTPTGKVLAEERHQYMVGYLKQFFREWNLD